MFKRIRFWGVLLSAVLAANTMIMPVRAVETEKESVIAEAAETDKEEECVEIDDIDQDNGTKEEDAAAENTESDGESVMNEEEGAEAGTETDEEIVSEEENIAAEDTESDSESVMNEEEAETNEEEEAETRAETDEESVSEEKENPDEETYDEDSALGEETAVNENDEDDTEDEDNADDMLSDENTDSAFDASSEEPAAVQEENEESPEEEQTEASFEPEEAAEIDETITEEESQDASLGGTVSHISVPVNGGWATKQITNVDDCLYFDIYVPSDGLLQITTQSFRSKTLFRLYNDDMSSIYSDFKEEKGSSTSPATRTISNWLKSGTYHLQIRNSYTQEYWFGGVGDVRVKAAFTPANNTEAEPNNVFGQAETLVSSRIIRGVILDIDDRCDFYKVTLQPGINTTLRITSYGENMSWAVYDSSFNEIMFERVPKGTDAEPKVVDYILEKPSNSLYYIRICDYYTPGSIWADTYSARGAYTLQWTQKCDHTFGKAKIEKPASNPDGLLSYTCSKCKTEKYEVIPCIESVVLTKSSYIYNGKAKTPGVIVKDRTGKIIDSGNYSVSYSTNRYSVGKHSVTVTFKNRYTGGITLKYYVKPASQKIKGASGKTLRKRTVKKNGAVFKIRASAKTSLSYKSKSKYITVNNYGRVTVNRKIPRGTYTVVIKAKKNYGYKSTQKKFKIRIK